MQALALVESPEHVCCRYRIRPFLPALHQQGCNTTVAGLARHPFARAGQLARVADHDVVLLQRKLLSGWQWSLLRHRAKRLIFDFDDAVFLRDSYDARGNECPRRSRRFRRVAREADLILAGNQFLADAAIDAGARPDRVQVIPTCVEPSVYPTQTDRPPGTGLDLTWIGSSSTLRGIEAKRELWEQIGRQIPNVRLRVVCDRFPRFHPLAVVDVPWDKQTEGAELARADVGVAWIPDDAWSRGKCGLKVLQYQAAGLPVIANPVGVHPEMVQPGKTGWLARTDDEWMSAVEQAVVDPLRRQAMGKAGRSAVETGYSVAAWADRFVNAVTRPGRMASGRVAVAS